MIDISLIKNYSLYKGDCLDILRYIPDKSIDFIFSDLPFGTSYADWDIIIPMDKLWKEYKRIIKPNRAILLHAVQPFTSLLVVSNLKWFRCEWIWNKKIGSNFANAHRQPLKIHEALLLFSDGQSLYNPQKVLGNPNHGQGRQKENHSEIRLIDKRGKDDFSGMKFPVSIIEVLKHSSQSKLHSMQKPLELEKYFIKTYSNEGDLVLDNCMGSGTVGEGCVELGRRFIGIEQDIGYFEIAKERLAGSLSKKLQSNQQSS